MKHKGFPLRTPDLSRENQAFDVGTSPSPANPLELAFTQAAPGTQY